MKKELIKYSEAIQAVIFIWACRMIFFFIFDGRDFSISHLKFSHMSVQGNHSMAMFATHALREHGRLPGQPLPIIANFDGKAF